MQRGTNDARVTEPKQEEGLTRQLVLSGGFSRVAGAFACASSVVLETFFEVE
jgi:hypothetical protein